MYCLLFFKLGSKGQNSDKQSYYIEDEFNIDLRYSVIMI